MFQVFRRSEENYWCYQEPLHELMLRISGESEELLQDTILKSKTLRHPELGKPYLAEYMPITARIGNIFAKCFPYDTYFLNPDEEDEKLRCYLELLIETSKGRPVLQLCRSSGRIGWLRKQLGGIHLFVWRNPWDQWWSYQVDSYFNTVNSLILNAPTAPPVIQSIRALVCLEDFHSQNIAEEFVFFSMRQPAPTASYQAFYAIWLHAMLEGLPEADIVINMEQLSNDRIYQKTIESELHKLGVNGIHFADCNIYQSAFLGNDKMFFVEAEKNVHQIFLDNGYLQVDLDHVSQLRDKLNMQQQNMATTIPQDLDRARGLLRREMADAAALRRRVIERNMNIERLFLDVERLRAELSCVHRSLSWRSTAGFRSIYSFMLGIYHRARNYLTLTRTK